MSDNEVGREENGDIPAPLEKEEVLSECQEFVRQLLDDINPVTATKYSIWNQIEVECDDEVHMDEQEVYAEVDAYVERRQNAKRETSEEADGQESKRMRCSLDTVLLVDEPLQQITGKAECTSKEILYSVWKHIHDNQLIQRDDPSLIEMDECLKALDERDALSIHEVTISFHYIQRKI